MPLTLRVTRAPAGARTEIRTLTGGSLTLGRSSDNDWMLLDPDRQLSKSHCTISITRRGATLRDTSSNGVFINGALQRVPRDTEVAIADGDEIQLGDYLILVEEAEAVPQPYATQPLATQPLATRPFAPPPAAPGHRAPMDDPFGGGGDVAGGRRDPFDDPFAASPPTGFAHPFAPPTIPTIRDPFDLADEAAPARRLDGDSGLFRQGASEDEWRGPSQPDHADAPSHAFSPPRVSTPPAFDELDIDALLGDTPPGAVPEPSARADPFAPRPPAPPPAAPARPDPFAEPPRGVDPFEGPPRGDGGFGERPRAADPFEPEARGAADPFGGSPRAAEPLRGPSREIDPFEPAPSRATPVAAPTPAPPEPRHAAAAAAPRAEPAAAALLATFLEGAGATGARMGDDPEAALREAGQLFRAMVDGLRQVLISRASVKSEFRVEQTILRTHGNNPIKFSVTTDEAVSALLEPHRPGYQTATAATAEAFDDVRSHELALMAGVQTALFGLLRRFEPEALEKRLQSNLLGNLVPGARKARMWELFCTTYEDIGREARDDFQSVFGREFARAYDAQARKT